MDFLTYLNEAIYAREAIKDNRGRIIGFYEKQQNGDVVVYNPQNHVIGRATKTGTFTHAGCKLSTNKEPALLFAQISL